MLGACLGHSLWGPVSAGSGGPGVCWHQALPSQQCSSTLRVPGKYTTLCLSPLVGNIFYLFFLVTSSFSSCSILYRYEYRFL